MVYPLEVGSTGDAVALLQDRLAWLGYTIAKSEAESLTFGDTTNVAVKRLQAKFFRQETGEVSEKFNAFIAKDASPLGKLPKRCRTGTIICVDKTQKLIRFVKNGNVKLTTDARFGIPGEETANGMHRIERKQRHNTSAEYGSPMPFSMFFFRNQAFHFSYWFRRDGYYGGSHGCINVRDWKKMAWLFNHSPIGTRVFIYHS